MDFLYEYSYDAAQDVPNGRKPTPYQVPTFRWQSCFNLACFIESGCEPASRLHGGAAWSNIGERLRALSSMLSFSPQTASYIYPYAGILANIWGIGKLRLYRMISEKPITYSIPRQYMPSLLYLALHLAYSGPVVQARLWTRGTERDPGSCFSQ